MLITRETARTGFDRAVESGMTVARGYHNAAVAPQAIMEVTMRATNSRAMSWFRSMCTRSQSRGMNVTPGSLLEPRVDDDVGDARAVALDPSLFEHLELSLCPLGRRLEPFDRSVPQPRLRGRLVVVDDPAGH